MFKDIKKWSDERKKRFSIILAVILTGLFAGSWFAVKSNISYFKQKDYASERALNDLKKSFGDLSKQFSDSKEKVFGTSTQTEEIIESTSSTSTENILENN